MEISARQNQRSYLLRANPASKNDPCHAFPCSVYEIFALCDKVLGVFGGMLRWMMRSRCGSMRKNKPNE